MNRYLILITGPFAGGKTELTRGLMRHFAFNHIPFSPEILTDSKDLMNVVRWDHEMHDGIHHVHMPGETPRPHPYDREHEHLTFINVHPIMQEEMHRRFFTELSQPRLDTRKFIFAELAAGVNGAEGANVDYSYETITSNLKKWNYPVEWISHVAAVIHVKSDFTLRNELNMDRQRKVYHIGDDEKGLASRPLPDAVMRFTEGDDFYSFRFFLENIHGLRNVRTVENFGTSRFIDNGRIALLECLGSQGLLEKQWNGKERR